MTAVVVFLVLALAWVLVSGRLESLSVTAPIVVTLLGFLAAVSPWHVDLSLESEQVRTLIEVTLAVVLFSDARRSACGGSRANGAIPYGC